MVKKNARARAPLRLGLAGGVRTFLRTVMFTVD